MPDLNMYAIVAGIIVTSVTAFLYFKLTVSAKEKERKRIEFAEKIAKQKEMAARLGWQKEEASSWNLTLKEYLLITGGSFVLILIVGFLLGNIFIAIGGGIAAYMLPRYLIKRSRKKEYKLRVRLLKPALQAVASAHTFKPNIVSAIQHATPSMQDPIKKEFEIFLMDTETGVPTRKALDSLKTRVNIKYLDFFVKVVIMAEEEGGKTHELIKTTADIIDQDMLVMEEFEAEVHKEKRTTIQLLFLQYLVLGFLAVTQPAAFAFYTESILGQIFILYILGSTAVAYCLLERFTDTSLQKN